MSFAPVLLDLAVVLATATVVAFIFQKLKQPVVLGYILAGALVGPLSPFQFLKFDLANIHFWADLGLIFLMFYLGLEFSFRRMFRSGLRVLWVGAFEITALFLVGGFVAKFFLNGLVAPAYFGAMVAISSTTIIIKAYDELSNRERRFSEKVYPLLIIEDLAAVLLIVILSSAGAEKEIADSHLLYLAAELLIVIGGWYLIGTFALPRLVTFFENLKKRELLTLVAIGLCLLISIGAARLGYSLALGAFITGSILAEMPNPERVQKIVQPLKDVFGAVFFVSVGMLVNFSTIGPNLGLIMALSAFVILAKGIAVTLGSLSAGQNFQTSLKTGLAMGQIGEFSFIIAGMGLAAGQVAPDFQPVIVTVAFLTAFTTPNAIRYSGAIASFLEARLPKSFRKFGERYRRSLGVFSFTGRLPTWMRSASIQFAVNTILVSLVFGSVRRHLCPWFADRVLSGNEDLALGLCLAGSILVCAPLLFAMLTCGRSSRKSFLFPALTLVWMAFLGSLFVNAIFAVALTLIFGLVVLGVFRQNLASTYSWLESRFLSGLQPSTDEISRFAPWDTHLVRLKVHPNAKMTGRLLCESDLTLKYGLSLVAIQRGAKLIAVPDKDERIMPFDELLLLGNDEQIDRARAEVEASVPVSHGLLDDGSNSFGTHDLSNFEMRSFSLGPQSNLVARRIRETKLREETGEWIVGVEREGHRVLSPHPDFELHVGDLVWTVGPRI
jgi:monovalent cation:H+ antiporter-2, CPA2 family